MNQLAIIPSIKEILENGEVKILPCMQGGMTKEVHLASIGEEKYILRRASTKENADRYERYSKELERAGVIPRMLERVGNDILFEFLEGRDLAYSDLDYAKDVGKISGLANNVPNLEDVEIDKRFEKALKYLFENGIVNINEKKKTEDMYKRFRPNVFTYATEVLDVIPGNYRLSNGKIFLVDMDAIWPMTKGRGFAKAFLKWFKDEEPRKKFLEGYNEVNDSSFLTPEYLQFIYLNFLVHKIKDWHQRGTSFVKVREWLQDSLEGRLN